jgi:hypothetical protein
MYRPARARVDVEGHRHRTVAETWTDEAERQVSSRLHRHCSRYPLSLCSLDSTKFVRTLSNGLGPKTLLEYFQIHCFPFDFIPLHDALCGVRMDEGARHSSSKIFSRFKKGNFHIFPIKDTSCLLQRAMRWGHRLFYTIVVASCVVWLLNTFGIIVTLSARDEASPTESTTPFEVPKSKRVVKSQQSLLIDPSDNVEPIPRPKLRSIVQGWNISGDPSWLLQFSIVGFPKSGTSTLMFHLREHPEIHMFKDERCELGSNQHARLIQDLYRSFLRRMLPIVLFEGSSARVTWKQRHFPCATITSSLPRPTLSLAFDILSYGTY